MLLFSFSLPFPCCAIINPEVTSSIGIFITLLLPLSLSQFVVFTLVAVVKLVFAVVIFVAVVSVVVVVVDDAIAGQHRCAPTSIIGISLQLVFSLPISCAVVVVVGFCVCKRVIVSESRSSSDTTLPLSFTSFLKSVSLPFPFSPCVGANSVFSRYFFAQARKFTQRISFLV